MQRIPVSLGFDFDKIVGFLQLTEAFANKLASAYQRSLTFRLDGAILIKDNHATLMEVSIHPIASEVFQPVQVK